MLWSQSIPKRVFNDEAQRGTEVAVIAGRLPNVLAPPPPPPSSWASRADANVAIWTLKMAPNAQWTLPPAAVGTNRTLYFFRGAGLRVADKELPSYAGARLSPDAQVPLVNGDQESELLLLQGRPINAPVSQHGPFVMTTRTEIQQAFKDYQRTGFGGWPWSRNDPVHPRERGRFAIHADGRTGEQSATYGVKSVVHSAPLERATMTL